VISDVKQIFFSD